LFTRDFATASRICKQPQFGYATAAPLTQAARLGFDLHHFRAPPARLFCKPVITDSLFYLVAAAAVTTLGPSMGGFSGIATPLLSLVVPPLQALGILLPALLAQDALSVWAFRRTWSGWNLAVSCSIASPTCSCSWSVSS
jgi:hypothetical protein